MAQQLGKNLEIYVTKKNIKIERPVYIIKVHRDWKYGPRARFWDIMKWYEGKDGSGYWSTACKGGLAYTEFGMWRAINKRLKKMKFGYFDEYYSLNREKLDNIK